LIVPYSIRALVFFGPLAILDDDARYFVEAKYPRCIGAQMASDQNASLVRDHRHRPAVSLYIVGNLLDLFWGMCARIQSIRNQALDLKPRNPVRGPNERSRITMMRDCG
jgi:hypothetical protein